MATTRPDTISGGCLCGSIAYNISFADDTAWPPMVATCQCSMCRKWTGCLITHDLIVKKTQLTPDLTTLSTFSEYESSPGTRRGFCSKCGASVASFNDHMPDDVIITVGTIDENHLLGRVVESSIKQDQHGMTFEREGGHAKEFSDPSMAGNVYWQNAVPGVTDHLSGPKFLQHFIGSEPLP